VNVKTEAAEFNTQMPPRGKDRTQFLFVLNSVINSHRIDTTSKALIVGGSMDDADALKHAGFSNISISQFNPDSLPPKNESNDSQNLAIDVEDIQLENESFDLVFAHEVLHHCRSPHKALCEMLRVAKKYVMFLEPNDSLLMRWLEASRFSFPYELPAVIHYHGVSGGVRDSQIPNYIYRWNRRDVHKTVSSCIPEIGFTVVAHPYWDFNINEYDLSLRKKTRIGLITSLIGQRVFLKMLLGAKTLLNVLPLTERQGNKFFCVVKKHSELQPWLSRENGEVVFVGDRK